MLAIGRASVLRGFGRRAFPSGLYLLDVFDERTLGASPGLKPPTDSAPRILAYFPKTPGNFVQHNLANGCSHAQTEARYLIGTLHKRAPIRFFFRKNVKVREIALFA